ncbi:hypothetical protein FSARC_11380 [Fusarium sarcochroum]|uniref:Protein kinase domain-containing protein n=1 Tax=Fusarium sarcochroum TaxID=1208366 RepID=A0A8H4TFW4_9HYPO|nr:hypothetical protein FSARC_11380 [Fusarium sarcochroum]
MGDSVFQGDGEPYWPCDYGDDAEIPFAPDGNSPLISQCVEKVKGIGGRFNGLICVRKTIIDHTETDETLRLEKKRKLVQEAKILHFAKHHHVVELIHTYFVETESDKIIFSVIMDRADANLDNFIKPGKTPKTQWFGCLIRVMGHIHGLGIRHRDIKPSNILIKGDKILLADFGISLMGLGKTMPTTYQHRNAARTREYCAPEVESGSTRGRSADVFSLGAVFLEMLLAQTQPAKLRDLKEILESPSHEGSSYAKRIDQVHTWIAESLHFNGWQSHVLLLCQRMLHQERVQRPRAEEICSSLSKSSALSEPIRCQCIGDLILTGDSKLVEACKRCSEDEVKQALQGGADPSTLNAVHYAAERGSTSIVTLLLEHGVDVDVSNPTGQTALQCASRSGFEDVVKLLLENGADVNAKDENEQTALHGAAGQGHLNIVKMLLDAGADADMEDLDGNVAIHFAERRHCLDVVDLLECCQV